MGSLTHLFDPILQKFLPYQRRWIQDSSAIAVHTTTLDEAIAEGWFELLCQITGNDASFLDAQHYRKAMTQMYSPELLFCEPRKGT